VLALCSKQIVPLTLLKHHLNRHPANEQVYLHLYPKELIASLGTSPSLGYAIPNQFSLGTQVHRPKSFGLLIASVPTLANVNRGCR
jgi:hypothetical protein